MSASRTIPSRSPTITPHIETVCAKNTRICPTNSDKRASSPLYPGAMASNSISVSVNLNAAPDTAESNYLPLQNLCRRGNGPEPAVLTVGIHSLILMRPGGTPEGIIASGSNVDSMHSTHTRGPHASEALPGLISASLILPESVYGKNLVLSSGLGSRQESRFPQIRYLVAAMNR